MTTLMVVLSFAALLYVVDRAREEAAPPIEGTPAPSSAPSSPSPPAEQPPDVPGATLGIVGLVGERVEVQAEVADDASERAQGLSDRAALAPDAGMLFVFNRERPLSFTMQDTYIPLSIAFIDDEGVILDIQDMEPLDDLPPNYVSAAPARYALEVNQGFFGANGVEVGDRVELPELPASSGRIGTPELVQAFREAGLEVGEAYPVEEEPDWEERPVPRTYREAARFEIPSLGEDAGGRVFVFASEGDLDGVRDYYESLPAPIRPYIYARNGVLLQLTNALPEAEAERYAAVLDETA